MPIWHVTVQFSTHCVMSLYVPSFCQYCTCRYDMLQCSSAHPVSCLCMYRPFANSVHADMTYYRAVQHTLCHVSVCTVLLPVLYMPLLSVPLCHQTVCSLHLLSFSVCNISAASHSVCNAWSLAANFSLAVSPFTAPLHNHNHVTSPPTSCLSVLLIHWPLSGLLSHIFFKVSSNIGYKCWILCFLFHCYQFSPLILLQPLLQSQLLISYIFIAFLTLTIFTNRSSVYLVFRYSAVFIYLCFICLFNL